jgi:uncharacterized protein (DUF362 family)
MFRPDLENIVALATSKEPSADYGSPITAPDGEVSTLSATILRDLLESWQLDRARAGTVMWNPLGEFIRPGAKVVIKPNWVYHAPQGPATLDCLITHTSVIEAVLDYVARASPAEVVVGDAPIQSCDFETLRNNAGLSRIEKKAESLGVPMRILDFRRTISPSRWSRMGRTESARPLDRFVEFDLGDESCLQPLDHDYSKFRVTAYNPDLLHGTHRPGSHRYLIAREVLDADVVVNLPKLKCHMKACVTGALKNLVGINGHKEYLPHHRKGGSARGGDCYPDSAIWKHVSENIADFVNRGSGIAPIRFFLASSVAAGRKIAAATGGDANLEGSWYGNDTVWRMCLDLNRILQFGGTDGRLHAQRQRSIINIIDAVVAGEGNGPLKPTPVKAGFMTGAVNPAAAEYVNARLMGFDPAKIPLIREAFAERNQQIAEFSPEQIIVRSKWGEWQGPRTEPIRIFIPPAGWRNNCELESENLNLETGLAII